MKVDTAFSLINTHRKSPRKRKTTDGLCETETDYYPTPPWATRSLINVLKTIQAHHCFADLICEYQHVLEPGSGNGHMAKPLAEYFHTITTLDIVQRDFPLDYVEDFLAPTIIDTHTSLYDWIIANPPFQNALQFVLQMRALKPKKGLCALLPVNFLRSKGRYESILCCNPPDFVLNFSERINIRKNICQKKGSSAAQYVWCIWLSPPYTNSNTLGSELIYLTHGLQDVYEKQGDYDV